MRRREERRGEKQTESDGNKSSSSKDMRETGTNSPMPLRGLEIMIRESFAGSGRVGPGASSDKEDVAEERELSDLCTLGEKDNEEEEHQENATEEATDKEAGKRRRDRLLTEAETMTVNREENNRRRVASSSSSATQDDKLQEQEPDRRRHGGAQGLH